MKIRRFQRAVLFATLGVAAVWVSIPTPAQAWWRGGYGGWRGGDRCWRCGYGPRWGGGFGPGFGLGLGLGVLGGAALAPPVIYAPPPVVYAPPPVYYYGAPSVVYPAYR